jgi:hypothetical protein
MFPKWIADADVRFADAFENYRTHTQPGNACETEPNRECVKTLRLFD